MRFPCIGVLVLAVLVGGCATPGNAAKDNAGAEEAYPWRQKLLVSTDGNLLVGTVALYNTPGRFVVLDFPIGKVPAPETVMFVYRRGLKVGEVRITGPERDNKTVGDLISGEAQKGDEVCNQ